MPQPVRKVARLVILIVGKGRGEAGGEFVQSQTDEALLVGGENRHDQLLARGPTDGCWEEAVRSLPRWPRAPRSDSPNRDERQVGQTCGGRAAHPVHEVACFVESATSGAVARWIVRMLRTRSREARARG